MSFQGSLEDLTALVSLLHLQGHWIDEGPLQTFSTESGEHINFWPASGELQVKGHPQASHNLEARLGRAISSQGSRVSLISHHLLLCATPAKALCCPDPAVGVASWSRLKQLVRELGLEDPARKQGIVLRTKADCLRICAEGPILLIWPDGVIYGGVTAERLERILKDHVIGGVPIENWVVGRNEFRGGTPGLRNADRPGFRA